MAIKKLFCGNLLLKTAKLRLKNGKIVVRAYIELPNRERLWVSCLEEDYRKARVSYYTEPQ